jgi:tetratricopeptide (TPR) repeat protein
MIVKNEQANIEACLAGVRDLVDEMIVVDTGSTDDTRAIATRLGARVFDFPWTDDFAAARNAALSHANGGWIFWLDADDRIDAENRDRLRKLFASLRDENVAYHMICRSLDPSGTTTTDHVRLFPNRPQIRWQHRIHEQILPAVRSCGGVSRPTDIVILHTGYQDAALYRRKLERNLKLLERERAEHPEAASVLYHLGLNYTAVGRPAEALPILRQGLALWRDGDPYLRGFYGQLARAHHVLGQRAEAIQVCKEGTARLADDAELLFVQCTLQTETGDLSAAEAGLLRLLDATRRFVSTDTGLTGYKARQNLAMIYRKQNRLADAETQLRLVVAEQLQFALGRLALADVLISLNRPAEVEAVLHPLAGVPAIAVEVALMRARALHMQRDLAAARSVLEVAAIESPANLRLLGLLTQVLIEQGTDRAAAIRSLRAILAIDPNHPAAKRMLEAMGK